MENIEQCIFQLVQKEKCSNQLCIDLMKSRNTSNISNILINFTKCQGQQKQILRLKASQIWNELKKTKKLYQCELDLILEESNLDLITAQSKILEAIQKQLEKYGFDSNQIQRIASRRLITRYVVFQYYQSRHNQDKLSSFNIVIDRLVEKYTNQIDSNSYENHADDIQMPIYTQIKQNEHINEQQNECHDNFKNSGKIQIDIHKCSDKNMQLKITPNESKNNEQTSSNDFNEQFHELTSEPITPLYHEFEFMIDTIYSSQDSNMSNNNNCFNSNIIDNIYINQDDEPYPYFNMGCIHLSLNN